MIQRIEYLYALLRLYKNRYNNAILCEALIAEFFESLEGTNNKDILNTLHIHSPEILKQELEWIETLCVWRSA